MPPIITPNLVRAFSISRLYRHSHSQFNTVLPLRAYNSHPDISRLSPAPHARTIVPLHKSTLEPLLRYECSSHGISRVRPVLYGSIIALIFKSTPSLSSRAYISNPRISYRALVPCDNAIASMLTYIYVDHWDIIAHSVGSQRYAQHFTVVSSLSFTSQYRLCHRELTFYIQVSQVLLLYHVVVPSMSYLSFRYLTTEIAWMKKLPDSLLISSSRLLPNIQSHDEQ